MCNPRYGAETVNTAANRETVLAAAAQGLVLLVNKVPIGVGTDHTLCDAPPPLPVAQSHAESSWCARPLQPSVKKLALVGPNVENVVTHDCGVRKEPSYLGCEGCYCKPPRYR